MKKILTGLFAAAFSISAMANQVDINKASKDELLKGIQGLSDQQAQAIIDYRKEAGGFIRITQLLYIGVGPDIIGPNYDNLKIGTAQIDELNNHEMK